MSNLNKGADDRKLMDRIAPDPSRGPLIGIVATTYEMQPEFFETDFVPTIFGLGALDDRDWSSRIAVEKQLAELETVTVFLDARPYRARPRSLRVEVRPVLLDNARILHAKIVLVVYQQAIRLIVGSANMTEPGYRKNREVVAVLTASEKRPSEASLIAQSIRELTSLAVQWMTPGARRLCDAAMARLNLWKVNSVNANEWFVWGGGAVPLWRQFLDRWSKTDKINTITIVSPFWSEEMPDGPISGLVTELRKAGYLGSQVELRLLTEAAPDKQATYKPKLPETFRAFDATSLGVHAFALAVDPQVSPEEAGMGEDFTGTRNLHAKIVLFEGSETSLLYIGSANFTHRGWGFLSDPAHSNIEAGIVVRRSGKFRAELRGLLPAVTGHRVSLAGAAAGSLALPDPLSDELPWPQFIREVLLSTTASNPEMLELIVTVTIGAILGSWELRHLTVEGMPQETIVSVDNSNVPQTIYRVVLTEQSLARLLCEQEIQVIWWECPAGRAVPINVSQSARESLPISPHAGRLEEKHLIAYYQGRITWEDLFPDPEVTDVAEHDAHAMLGNSGVDTSRIQSYIVREFVEALTGINDDLKAAAQAPKACMRLALLGSVSPIALARQVVEAARTGHRTATATGFQLVEILACLFAARDYEASVLFRNEWVELVDEASTKLETMLTQLQASHPDELSANLSATRKQSDNTRLHVW